MAPTQSEMIVNFWITSSKIEKKNRPEKKLLWKSYARNANFFSHKTIVCFIFKNYSIKSSGGLSVSVQTISHVSSSYKLSRNCNWEFVFLKWYIKTKWWQFKLSNFQDSDSPREILSDEVWRSLQSPLFSVLTETSFFSHILKAPPDLWC